jgi:hypothetical protein
MLPILLWLAAQDEPIGWTCNVERKEGDLVYVAQQSVEGGRRFSRTLRAKWMRDSFTEDAFVEWDSMDDPPPGVPHIINFRVPLTKRTSRLILRITFPDASTDAIVQTGNTWRTSLYLSTDGAAKRPVALFQSLDRDNNRRLWAARHFRVVVEDRNGQVLGVKAIDLPDPAELMRLDNELGRALDAKLDDASKQCSGYGPEAYVDPVVPRGR